MAAHTTSKPDRNNCFNSGNATAFTEQQGGSIVCTSSAASTIGERERPSYAASKAAINSLCRHVASRWGKKGIRCNALAPGFIATETTKENMPAEILDAMLKGYNSDRHGNTLDIAAAVAFLMSDEAGWVNGQVWHINGGAYYAN
ncbi:SDR family NAD(P)-dependent oxidoreductase [Oceanicoccus sp. KOV_DT_Chl]|uniref:SDR family NAD(P)-dependent oxidoreductase n=1 Tax=Oceanicoccus sp. KOV_DT_Chl TaxID=1904639 RepID=UPI0021008128|nr:SDR family oxidoreductase [Oceanicoccus sp. KOV_DT_Chl]